MREMGRRGTAARALRALLATGLCVACGADPEGSPAGESLETRSGASELATDLSPELPPEQQPPVPPLVGAERPRVSPLVAILDEPVDLIVEIAKLSPPTLEGPLAEESALSTLSTPEPVLELGVLVERLGESPALDVHTRVALENQIEALRDALRHHHRTGEGRFDTLERRYDALVLEIVLRVQDEDPMLARDLVRSRAAIWEELAEPTLAPTPGGEGG